MNIIKKFRKKIELNFKEDIEELKNLHKENLWANVFHDTIKDKKWLQELSISPGRWAANYSLLYLLVRVLNNEKIHSILELGLGESTKLANAFIKNTNYIKRHDILEHDKNWLNTFERQFILSEHSQVHHTPLTEMDVFGFKVTSYEDIQMLSKKKYDLYLIDGPFGSNNYSRFDIVSLLANFEIHDQFVIILDDYNREGEKQTADYLLKLFQNAGMEIFSNVFTGVKSQLLIATSEYKYLTTV